MSPLVIIAAQTLACVQVTENAVSEATFDAHTPHLVVTERTYKPVLKTVCVVRYNKECLDPRLFMSLRTSAFERANPNQPWYAKLGKRKQTFGR